ncbi:zinc finger MYM-type protein 1-like [Acyrthosiphon pisum]|uniref:DUF4371 domain-containing protein n=1 Tax=Acyrthosiphon pisum TaxID=7029 RepID=A0A8R2B7D8_ACYPI|nr:zinc finger MYM-type protein 1-like [Acyrthosiphon pisum]|eukprot:XP_008184893.1 PREDICTED: zinc finger MYM-type protein 1-like [Acyrthosiphon pisum]
MSVQHIDACKVRVVWVDNETIDKITERQYSEEATFWRKVLHRIIKIILHLTSGNTALRGHEQKNNNPEQFDGEGNFMRTVRLLADWKIQNELIDLLATSTRNLICEEIRHLQCFSIIMDSTQDITKLDQVSIVIRYVVINHNESSISVKESFLGFFVIEKHGAQDYEELITNILVKLNIDINKCRGQGYDGASVMSGVYSGVQKRIKVKVPTASYVHCCAHNLNLVISDAAKSSQKVVSFFETVQAVLNFFSASAPRWANLAFGNDENRKIKLKVLKKGLFVKSDTGAPVSLVAPLLVHQLKETYGREKAEFRRRSEDCSEGVLAKKGGRKVL